MHRLLFAAFLTSNLAEAASLRFKPDTVWTGYGALRYKSVRTSDSTTVTNSTSSNIDLKLKYLITPFKHSRNRVMYFAPNRKVYIYRFDSTIATGTRFLHRLSRDTNYQAISIWTRMEIGDLKLPEISLGPGKSVVLGNFRLDDCEVFPVRKMSTFRCQDEGIEILFDAGASKFDTLHGIMNSWSSGIWGGSPPKFQGSSAKTGRRYTLDGKALPWTSSDEIRDIGSVSSVPFEE
jgi:hypothetical protein